MMTKNSSDFNQFMFDSSPDSDIAYELGLLVGKLRGLVVILEDDAGKEAGPEFCRALSDVKRILNIED